MECLVIFHDNFSAKSMYWNPLVVISLTKYNPKLFTPSSQNTRLILSAVTKTFVSFAFVIDCLCPPCNSMSDIQKDLSLVVTISEKAMQIGRNVSCLSRPSSTFLVLFSSCLSFQAKYSLSRC